MYGLCGVAGESGVNLHASGGVNVRAQVLAVPSSPSTQARQLIHLVSTDVGLAANIRSQAKALKRYVASNPDLVLRSLEALYDQHAPTLARVPPNSDYARVVPLRGFWVHNVSAGVKVRFGVFANYERHIGSLSSPENRLRADLKDGHLCPAEHSWMAPWSTLAGMTGVQLRQHLIITASPPYVVMVFPGQLMAAVGVSVRNPRGIDAIPGPSLQWYAGGVPNEKVDGDIPLSALGSLRWVT